MKVIKTRKELLKLLNGNKDLIIDDDVTIEFSTSREDVRNVSCYNLFMVKGNNRFDLSIGGNFNGRDFNGGNFTGGDISYNAFFCCYGRIIKSGVITARHPEAVKPIELEKV